MRLSIRLFPAHAGMNRCAISAPPINSAVPRTRGDEPVYIDYLAASEPCSPAHAGMNRGVTRSPHLLETVPRTRGDEPAASKCVASLLDCSPHTRG